MAVKYEVLEFVNGKWDLIEVVDTLERAEEIGDRLIALGTPVASVKIRINETDE